MDDDRPIFNFYFGSASVPSQKQAATYAGGVKLTPRSALDGTPISDRPHDQPISALSHLASALRARSSQPSNSAPRPTTKKAEPPQHETSSYPTPSSTGPVPTRQRPHSAPAPSSKQATATEHSPQCTAFTTLPADPTSNAALSTSYPAEHSPRLQASQVNTPSTTHLTAALQRALPKTHPPLPPVVAGRLAPGYWGTPHEINASLATTIKHADQQMQTIRQTSVPSPIPPPPPPRRDPSNTEAGQSHPAQNAPSSLPPTPTNNSMSAVQEVFRRLTTRRRAETRPTTPPAPPSRRQPQTSTQTQTSIAKPSSITCGIVPQTITHNDTFRQQTSQPDSSQATRPGPAHNLHARFNITTDNIISTPAGNWNLTHLSPANTEAMNTYMQNIEQFKSWSTALTFPCPTNIQQGMANLTRFLQQHSCPDLPEIERRYVAAVLASVFPTMDFRNHVSSASFMVNEDTAVWMINFKNISHHVEAAWKYRYRFFHGTYVQSVYQILSEGKIQPSMADSNAHGFYARVTNDQDPWSLHQTINRVVKSNKWMNPIIITGQATTDRQHYTLDAGSGQQAQNLTRAHGLVHMRRDKKWVVRSDLAEVEGIVVAVLRVPPIHVPSFECPQVATTQALGFSWEKRRNNFCVSGFLF